MNSKFLLFVIVGLIVSTHHTNDVFADERNSVGQIQLLEESYSSTGTGVVRVIDPHMNLDPEIVDVFDVDVWSDSDFAGIDLTVSETGDSTGIFEGTVFFSTANDSSGHRLRVGNEGTIYSKYDDSTLPESFDVDKIDLISTASIHGTGIPTEDRVSLDKKSYVWNDKVIITINAPEENLDGDLTETIDSSKNSIKITTRHSEINDYSLVETGDGSGVFVGEIILVDESSDIDSDGISVFFEYEEDKVAIGSAPIILNYGSSDFTIGKVQWFEDSHSADGFAVIQVIDPDMNLSSNDIDKFEIHIWSDSDSDGISPDAYETGRDTGIFESNIYFSEKPSTGQRLHIVEDDLVIASYEDDTLPLSYSSDKKLKILDSLIIRETFINSEENHGFFRIDDTSFSRQSLQTGETISESGMFTAMIMGSLGPILIIFFITLYALKKIRAKKSIEKQK